MSRKVEQITKRDYDKIHTWLRQTYGRASTCGHSHLGQCSETFSWAVKHNKNHAYRKENYMQLCVHHHKKYDIETNNFRKYLNNPTDYASERTKQSQKAKRIEARVRLTKAWLNNKIAFDEIHNLLGHRKVAYTYKELALVIKNSL